MIKKITVSFLIICLLSACGYSRLDKLTNSDYSFSDINITGNKSIGYLIKNELRLIDNNDSKNNIYLDLNVKSKKNISEKNEKNQITKFSIEISVEAILKDNTRTVFAKENFSVKDNYKVEKNSINTQNNQKKLRQRLTRKISNRINMFVSSYFE